MRSVAAKVDRAALVRRALVELVAENGFRGTAMAAVAARAGVATGTAYVHYASKDDLVLAAYLEVKAALGRAAAAATSADTSASGLFDTTWRSVHAHLAADPVQARFLVQVESSPYASSAHEAAMSQGDLLGDARFDELRGALVELPPLVLWDLGLGPAIRAVAFDTRLTDAELGELAAACWRAVSSS
ncbi:MAG: TetR family transcriptional regulator [Acidimicrobiia bacterium]|nr:TetR family transcriptional regulator [Acidimicrobiia bacterium]